MLDLNREIAALVRAGVPLESGLVAAAEDLNRPAADLTRRLSDRLAAGASLREALAAEGARVPRDYRAVVESGLRAGRLPQTLEALAVLAESMREARRRFGLALIYPLIVLALGYLFFVGFIRFGAPGMIDLYRTMRLPEGFLLQTLTSLHETVPVWGWLVPLLAALLLGLAAALGGAFQGSGSAADAAGGRLLRMVPGLRRIRANSHRGRFCEVLSVLIQNQVPLPEALPLAAEAIGDPDIARDARRLAEEVTRGGTAAEGLRSSQLFTPLLRWLMTAGESAGGLAGALRRAGDLYNRRAGAQLEWFKFLAPVVALAAIGGSVVLGYGLAVFLPLMDLLTSLTVEPHL